MNPLIFLSFLLCLVFLTGALFLRHNARYEVHFLSPSRLNDPDSLRKIEKLAGGVMLRLVAEWWTRQMSSALRADAALQARVLASASQFSGLASQEELEQQFRSRFARLAAERLLTNYPAALIIQAGPEVSSGFLSDVLAPICAYEPALFPTRRMTVKRDWVRLSRGGGSGHIVYRRGYYFLRGAA